MRRPTALAVLALLVVGNVGCVPTVIAVRDDTAGVLHTGDTAFSRAARSTCAGPAAPYANARAATTHPSVACGR